MEQNKRQQIRDEVGKIFSDNNISHEFDVDRNNHVRVIVEDGDWKHDHLRLRRIMTLNNFICLDEILTDDEDDDSYSAEYCFFKSRYLDC